jgi:hypothetical protein
MAAFRVRITASSQNNKRLRKAGRKVLDMCEPKSLWKALAFLAAFITLSTSLPAQPVYDTCRPNSNSWGTGYCTSSNKYWNQVEWYNGTTEKRGWVDFTIPPLPYPITQYDTAKICFYIDSVYSSPQLTIMYSPHADPQHQSPGDLFDSLASDSCYQVEQYSSPGVAWHSDALPAWANWLNGYPQSNGHMIFSWTATGSQVGYGEADGNNPPRNERTFITIPLLVFVKDQP